MKSLTLSRKAKESIKFALAYVIVFYIALKASWMNPYWAGFAVVMLALVPDGQSIHKGLQRVAGTIPGGLVAIIIFHFAPQDRWLFVGLSALWIFFITYMMMKTIKNQYFWHVSGFVTLVILLTLPPDSANIFNHVVMRILETTMGVAVYTLVSVFIWPQNNLIKVENAAVNLLDIQTKIFNFKSENFYEESNQTEMIALRAQEIQALSSLHLSYINVSSENYRAYEALPLWEKFHKDATQLMKSFLYLQNNFAGFSNIDRDKLLPNLPLYKEQVQTLLENTRNYFSKTSIDKTAHEVELELNHDYFMQRNAYEKIAISSGIKTLEHIKHLSQSLCTTSEKIMNNELNLSLSSKPHTSTINFLQFITPDIDKLKAASITGLVVILGFLLWVFFDPVGHAGWFQLPATVFIVVATMPQIQIKKVLPLLSIFTIFFLGIYTLVMPHFTSFLPLAILLFTSVFIIIYVLPIPARPFGLIPLLMMVHIENEQTYSFAAQANTAMYLLMAMGSVYVFSYFIGSPRPEKVFLKLMHRYFKSATYLLEHEDIKHEHTLVQKMQYYFYVQEMNNLPHKISAWSTGIDTTFFQDNAPEKIQKILNGINILSLSLLEFQKARQTADQTLFHHDIRQELLSWHKGLLEVMRSYEVDLSTTVSKDIRSSIKQFTSSIQKYLYASMQESSYSNLGTQDKENLFKYLESLQSLSFALISYTKTSESVHWKNWEEERFS